MKKVVNAVLIFLLIILVLALTIVITTKQTILNEQYVMDKIDSISYYEKITNSLKESFQNNIIQSGIEIEFAEKLIDEQKIKEDINGVIHAIYSGTNYTVSTDDLKNKLNTKINEVLSEKNASLSQSDEQSIKEFLDIISGTYTTEINIIADSHNTLNNVVDKVNSYLPTMVIVLVVLICILCVILFIINKNVKFLSITFLANALFFLFVYIFVHNNIVIDNITIFTDEFSSLLSSVINGFVGTFLFASIAYFVLGFVFMILSVIFGNGDNRMDRKRGRRSY